MRTVIGMATTNARMHFAEQALSSLAPQADIIHLHNNDQDGLPDLADNGKFAALQFFNEPLYYFSCDDDIIYPPKYIESMKKMIDALRGLVTHHGRILKGKGLNYYSGHRSFSCSQTVGGPRRIDVAGTGVCGFRTDLFNPTDIYRSPDLRMSDLVFSLEAAKQGVPIYMAPHQAGYFRLLHVPPELTCFGMEHNNPKRQGEIADEIYDLRYGK